MDRPEILLTSWDRGYKLQNYVRENKREVISFRNHYIIAATGNDNPRWVDTVPEWYEAFVNNQLDGYTWDDYKRRRFEMHIIVKNDIFYKCSCGHGVAKKACKHCLLLMVKDGRLAFPPEVTAHPLDVRRKKGRPRKVKGALHRD